MYKLKHAIYCKKKKKLYICIYTYLPIYATLSKVLAYFNFLMLLSWFFCLCVCFVCCIWKVASDQLSLQAVALSPEVHPHQPWFLSIAPTWSQGAWGWWMMPCLQVALAKPCSCQLPELGLQGTCWVKTWGTFEATAGMTGQGLWRVWRFYHAPSNCKGPVAQHSFSWRTHMGAACDIMMEGWGQASTYWCLEWHTDTLFMYTHTLYI